MRTTRGKPSYETVLLGDRELARQMASIRDEVVSHLLEPRIGVLPRRAGRAQAEDPHATAGAARRAAVEAAPQLGAARNQVVHFRIDNLQRERSRQAGRATLATSIYSNLEPFPAVPDPEALAWPLGRRLPKQHKLPGPVANQVARRSAAK